MDIVKELIPEFAVEGRVVAAEQEFERQWKTWEFAIEKQKLFREDIRDLVELTVGRMDIYHLVGALLLEFCMTFYCENEMLEAEEADYPTWLISLFMISNFCAIGFLSMAVWLAMHASVASHSIGVRLLLRIVRPDVPGADAISNVRVPLASWLSGNKQQEKTDSITAAVQDAGINERNHFKEFLQRQRSWLCYDAYARSCMCLGMNAMLIALSYYIIGRISEKNAVSAVSSLLGVQLLSVLLLVLDVRHDRNDTLHDEQRIFFNRALTNKSEAVAVLCLLVFPPVYSLLLVWAWPQVESRFVCCLSTVSFLLHAGWLEYIYQMTATSPDDLLPRRLRAVGFMDVMSPDELELGAEDAAENIKKAHGQLKTCMERGDQMHMLEGFRDDLIAQVQAARHVRSMAFAAESDELPDAPQEAREGPRVGAMIRSRQAVRAKRLELDRDIKQALHLLTVFKDVHFLWKTAPQILGSAKALLAVGGLKPAEQTQVQRILEDFPKQYGALRQQMQKGIQRGEEHIYFAMGAITEEDPLPMVAVEEGDPGSRVPVVRWYRPEDRATVLRERPADRRSTTFNEAVTLNSSWRHSRELLLAGQGSYSLAGSGFEFSAARNFTISASAVQDGANIQLATRSSRQTSAAAQGQGRVANQLPHMTDRLPRDVVRVFIRGCMILWLLSAIAHLVDGLRKNPGEGMRQKQSFEPPVLETRQLDVNWPSPAALFEISALHCPNNSALLVSSRFGLYGAQWQPLALDAFEQVASNPASAVVCDGDGCSAFMKGQSGQDEWTLATITRNDVPLGDPLAVPIPASWRVMSAMWEPCSSAIAPCESAVLAGWTGAEVVIAEAHRKIPAGSWQVQTSFAVRPELATCEDDYEAESCAATGGLMTYEEVQALHLGPERILTVLLSNGRLDAWDLASGAFLGQWHIRQGNYTAMCIREHEVVLVQRGGRLGPQLHVATLPSLLSNDAGSVSISSV
eukprot:TRINITY_DN7675_c0_g2_i1.p1 TRINITY_DN7675_c0_g2~~TRINITY_DN7675_c0_g2_i1.p1  ORF type:complete len:972 (-),score=185.39 TRINITY_DN7675_c0_g2_i1:40-2955(-)